MFEREYRELSFVPRWSIARLLRRQSVAEHSYYVALYAHQMALTLQLEPHEVMAVTVAALYEDLEESFTGDIPGPSKRSMLYDKHRFYEWCTGMVEDRFGVFGGNMWWAAKDETVGYILKAANLMDEVAHLSTELQMGNKAAMPMWLNSFNRLRAALGNLQKIHPILAHKVNDLLDDFCVSHRDQQSQIPLNDDDVQPACEHEEGCGYLKFDGSACTCGAQVPF